MRQLVRGSPSSLPKMGLLSAVIVAGLSSGAQESGRENRALWTCRVAGLVSFGSTLRQVARPWLTWSSRAKRWVGPTEIPTLRFISRTI